MVRLLISAAGAPKSEDKRLIRRAKQNTVNHFVAFPDTYPFCPSRSEPTGIASQVVRSDVIGASKFPQNPMCPPIDAATSRPITAHLHALETRHEPNNPL